MIELDDHAGPVRLRYFDGREYEMSAPQLLRRLDDLERTANILRRKGQELLGRHEALSDRLKIQLFEIAALRVGAQRRVRQLLRRIARTAEECRDAERAYAWAARFPEMRISRAMRRRFTRRARRYGRLMWLCRRRLALLDYGARWSKR